MLWSLSVEEIAKAVSGKILSRVHNDVLGVGTDTRRALTNQLFVALKGDSYDAHKFLTQAVESGAAALLVHETPSALATLQKRVSVIQVADTLMGLQQLATYWRRKNQFQVVGISGSNGKTSTKEFAYSLLKDFVPTYASVGSFNNHWGVPLSILQAQPQHRLLILEMGMNHQGELTRLTQIAEPNVVGVTMVGRAHIGELGSQAQIALAKEEMYVSCPKAVQFFNIDNEWTIEMHQRALKRQPNPQKIITFSAFRPQADVFMRVHKLSPQALEIRGRILDCDGVQTVPVSGRHNIVNLMAASCVALSQGMTPQKIWQQLALCSNRAWGRNQMVRLPNGGQVLFDAYNANPESMTALIKNILEYDCTGRKILVLGEMLELGEQASTLHQELGALVARSGIDVVWFLGPHWGDFKAGLESADFKKTSYFSENYEDTLASKIGAMINPQDLVALKGSRGMKLERVLESWRPLDFNDPKSAKG